MRRLINGLLYDTTKAILLADNTSTAYLHQSYSGRETYLYRTQRGRFFAYHVPCRPRATAIIEPISDAQALDLYEQLNDDTATPFEEAFLNTKIEEA